MAENFKVSHKCIRTLLADKINSAIISDIHVYIQNKRQIKTLQSHPSYWIWSLNLSFL